MAQPHVVRNGYLAKKSYESGRLLCWEGDVIDVAPADVPYYTRLGLIGPETKLPHDGIASVVPLVAPALDPMPEVVPQVEPVTLPSAAPLADEPEHEGPPVDVAPSDEAAVVETGELADPVEWRDTVQTAAPAPRRKRGRPRKVTAPAVDPQ